MSVPNPWNKHYQAFWEMQSGNPCLALWLRVVCVAYGNNRKNGHCPLGPGALQLALAVMDNGQPKMPEKNRVSEAIATAIKYQFLDPSSNARCLVVPRCCIRGGVLGSVGEQCKYH